MIKIINCELWLIIFGTLVSILLRCITTLHPYSGQAKPPMYGDYEAQRHWMEITVNLPINQWYHNTTDNNLLYWGLDYPPLTAYHMYLCGLIAERFNSNFTELHASRGYESESHKLFMRSTVLLADLTVYIPAMIFYFIATRKLYSKSDSNKKVRIDRPMQASLSIVLALLYPGLILIDHGHFQYNCVSLGLFVHAVTFLMLKRFVISSILFCLALNYKQMELYHALPFFFYLLSSCVPRPGDSSLSGVLRLAKLALAVSAAFAIIWSPFLFDLNDSMQVLHRLFPVARGVFEDKVSNVWCALNVFYKFKSNFDNTQMMRVCLFTTLTAIFPSSFDIFLRPNIKKFTLCLINSSLAFFLFSFQVHEKTILLVSVPVILYSSQEPFVCFWFLSISVFSMFPLLLKDGLVVAYVALQAFYVTSFRVSIEHALKSSLNCNGGPFEYYRSLVYSLLDIEYKKSNEPNPLKLTYRQILKNRESLKVLIFHCCMMISIFGSGCITAAMLIFDPPRRYPDLFPLIVSVYSCVHFLGFFVYFNVMQFKIPQEFEDYKIVKVKTS